MLDCDIAGSRVRTQVALYAHFRTNTHGRNEPTLLSAMGQLLPVLFFYKMALALDNTGRFICH